MIAMKDLKVSDIDIVEVIKNEGVELKEVGQNIFKGLCPFHGDKKTPSLAVYVENQTYYCFGCGEHGNVAEFIKELKGCDYPEAMKYLTASSSSGSACSKSYTSSKSSKNGKKILVIHDYKDKEGEVVYQVVRYEPKEAKDFTQRRPDGKGGYIYNMKDITTVPYNLPDVLKSSAVVIVEGEKDADTLTRLGIVATCNPMGAGKWKSEYNHYFKDKEVAILPDNDTVGKEHAQAVAKNLNGIAAAVKVVELPGLPDKGDVTDWLAQGETKEKLLELIEAGEQWTEPEVDNSFIEYGKHLVNLEFKVDWLIDKLIPKQSITLFHGRGGIGKTWLGIQLANAVANGSPFMSLETQQAHVIYVDLENSKPVLIDRMRAVGALEVGFWHLSNPTKPPRLDEKEWVRYLTLPKGLLIFDTLRAAQSGDENSSKDMAVVMNRLKELREAGFTVVLLHHTPKGNERTYKGSTAILDLADQVLSLHKAKRNTYEEVDDDDDSGSEDTCYYFGTKIKTRYIPHHIFLSFNSKGKGFEVATDPYEEKMKDAQELLNKAQKPLQQQVFKKMIKDDMDLTETEARKIIRKGRGIYWETEKGNKNSTLYSPLKSCLPVCGSLI